jgi:hypothetical protein
MDYNVYFSRMASPYKPKPNYIKGSSSEGMWNALDETVRVPDAPVVPIEYNSPLYWYTRVKQGYTAKSTRPEGGPPFVRNPVAEAKLDANLTSEEKISIGVKARNSGEGIGNVIMQGIIRTKGIVLGGKYSKYTRRSKKSRCRRSKQSKVRSRK